MRIPTEAEVQECLATLTPHIRRAAEGAFERFRGLSPADRLDLAQGRVYANMIWSFFWSEMRRTAARVPGCVLLERNGTVDLIVNDQVLLRFKRVSRKLLSRNYPTQTNLAFYAQHELPGIPASLPRLEIGWREDNLRLALGSLHVIMRVERRVAWSIPIHEERGGVLALQPTAASSSKAPRVRSRKLEVTPVDESAAR